MAFGIREIARIHHGLVAEVAAAQPDGAAGAGVRDVRGEAEAVLGGGVAVPQGVHVERDGAVVHHQVRAVQAVLGGGEDADLPPLGGGLHHGLPGLELDHAFGVVLQVFAHSRQIDGHRHLMLGEQPGRAQG